MDELLKRGLQSDASGLGTGLISASEAERTIEGLRCFDVEEVGCSKWMDQRECIDKLNLQAHYNAQSHSDEFVVAHLVSHDKVKVLVHELLAIEVWRSKVFPFLKDHMAKNVDSITWYYVLYHEVSLANMLEVCLFDQQSFQDLDDDHLLELCDWCHRKVIYLNTNGRKHAEHKDRQLAELLELGSEQELEEKCHEVDFSTATCAVTILRYLCDNIVSLPMGIMSRLLCSQDTIMSLLPLLEDPPWVRKRKGKVEKYIGNVWTAIDPTERFKITQLDAQVWLTLNTLIVEPKCRAKYCMDDFRRDRVLTLRRYFNDLLFDQLPILKDLERALDEITLGVGMDAGNAMNAGLILEQVPVIRENMIRGKDWEAIATNQKYRNFGEDSERMSRQRVEQMLKSFDFMCDMQPDTTANDSNEKTMSAHPPIRVEARRQVQKTKVWERISDYSFEINPDKVPEPVELSGGEGSAVHGKRYRLKPMDIENTPPLPANGKIVVNFKGKSAEAGMKLPAPATKDSSEIPSVVWLTVGLLATDGFALQLKLKKTERSKERNRIEGVWHVYHPIGGAITLKADD